MLVLSRKESERIIVGDDIAITVVRIDGDKVRLGVEAPRAIPVHREEIYLQILGDGDDASNNDATGESGSPDAA